MIFTHKLRIGMILWGVAVILFCPIGVATATVQISLRRDFGIDFFEWIQGQFTITGTGSGDIIELQLYFNDYLVKSVAGNSLSFSFSTDAYPPGRVNITLIAICSDYSRAQQTIVKEFMDPAVNIYLVVGVIIVVCVALYFKYGRRKRVPQ